MRYEKDCKLKLLPALQSANTFARLLNPIIQRDIETHYVQGGRLMKYNTIMSFSGIPLTDFICIIKGHHAILELLFTNPLYQCLGLAFYFIVSHAMRISKLLVRNFGKKRNTEITAIY